MLYKMTFDVVKRGNLANFPMVKWYRNRAGLKRKDNLVNCPTVLQKRKIACGGKNKKNEKNLTSDSLLIIVLNSLN
jgi:hypothetical protein